MAPTDHGARALVRGGMPRGQRQARGGSAWLATLPLCAIATWLVQCGAAWVRPQGFHSFQGIATRSAPPGLRGRPAVRAASSDDGEFDFGEYDAPVGIAIADAEEEEEGPQLAPPEAETFLQRQTGAWQCENCGFEYNKMWGHGEFGPGTAFEDLPSNWRCPQCRVSKDKFAAVTETVAGFAENQDYGLGFNTFTGTQKGFVIWGGLIALFFVLLGGYFIE